MTMTLLKVKYEDTVDVYQGKIEWDDLFFVKDKVKNDKIEKYFNFKETKKNVDVIFYNKSDVTILIENENVFVMKTEDDCPFWEKL
jgi:predicted protein tyrosine phosphatase